LHAGSIEEDGTTAEVLSIFSTSRPKWRLEGIKSTSVGISYFEI